MRSKDFEVIDRAVKRRGITVAELSRRVEMDPVLLHRSLDGARNIKSYEFVALCAELDLEIEDFKDCLPDALKVKV